MIQTSDIFVFLQNIHNISKYKHFGGSVRIAQPDNVIFMAASDSDSDLGRQEKEHVLQWGGLE